MGLANITCGQDYAILGQIIADLLGVNNFIGDNVNLCIAKS